MSARVGFVGAGRMGRPMMQRLLAAGHPVRVHCRGDRLREIYIADGAEPTTEIPEVAKGAGAVVVCVFSDQQVREVCLDSGLLDALEPGAVLIVHTTSSPRTSEQIAAAAAQRGVCYVDAAVSGGPHDVSAGEITLFVGGTDASWSRAQPFLATYGDPILHLGPVGTGMKIKLLNNATFAANIGVLAVVSDLARTLELDEAAVLTAVSHGSGNSAVLGMAASGGSVRGFSEMTAEFVDKDVHTAQGLLGELGASLDRLAPLYQAMRDIRWPDDRSYAGRHRRSGAS